MQHSFPLPSLSLSLSLSLSPFLMHVCVCACVREGECVCVCVCVWKERGPTVWVCPHLRRIQLPGQFNFSIFHNQNNMIQYWMSSWQFTMAKYHKVTSDPYCRLTWYEWKDLWCSSTVWLLSAYVDMNGRICGALVQFSCYHHKHKWMSSSPIYIRLSLGS